MPDLIQADADALIAMDKYCTDNSVWDYPRLGNKVAIPLMSSDEREHFFLDINRRSRNELKVTHQNRHVVLRYFFTCVLVDLHIGIQTEQR